MKKSPNPTDKHVGSRVRMRRMMLGMSQEKLAEGLGLTFQQVQKYEKGTNRIGASRLRQIASILQVPEGFFFEGLPRLDGIPDSRPIVTTFVDDFLATKDGIAIAQAFTTIADPRLRRRIVDLIEQIAANENPVRRAA